MELIRWHNIIISLFLYYAKKKNWEGGKKLDLPILEELFAKISEVTNLGDVGYHRIEDGRLKPVYKTQTDELGVERWKKVHGENPVVVKDTIILRELFDKKQAVTIYDTKNDDRSAGAFFLFGVDSILILPVIRKEEIKAIICIVSIGKLHEFTQDEITECSKLANDYLKDLY